jgi:glutamate racemase
VRWVDPAPAIARRVVELVGPATRPECTEEAQVIFTSGREVPAALTSALARPKSAASEPAPAAV